MSPESQSPPTEAPAVVPVLNLRERRVLGVLVEKAKTTPDTYPLSINALVVGCNQKSNRDPVLDLSDAEVEDTLVSVQKKGLAIKITGGRVVRWRHNLYDAWRLSKVELAVLGELLLRGPQTEGELRGRASRMEPIADVDALRAVLKPLAERRLVVYLSPEGRRGTTLTHGFHAPDELDKLRARHGRGAAEADEEQATAGPRSSDAAEETPKTAPAAQAIDHEAISALQGQVSKACAEMVELRQQLVELERLVKAGQDERAELARQLQQLRTSLGA